MKTRNLKTVMSLITVLFLLIGNTAMAQGHANRAKGKQAIAMEIPNLSADQKAKIQSLRTAAMKESLVLRSTLQEKRAHLNTLSIAENADQKAIDREIDDISKLQSKLMKINAKLRQDIRAILNDEQKVYFDTHYKQFMRKHGAMHKKAKYNKISNTPNKQ